MTWFLKKLKTGHKLMMKNEKPFEDGFWGTSDTLDVVI